MKKILIIPSVLILFCSCREKEDHNIEDSYNLYETDSIKQFALGDKTSINSFYKLQSTYTNDTTYIYFFDNYKNELWLYNTLNPKKKYQKKISFKGPNSISKSSQNHAILNRDNFENFIIYEANSRSFNFFKDDTLHNRIKLEKLYKNHEKKLVSWYGPPIPENILIKGDSLLFPINNQISRIESAKVKDFFNYGILDYSNEDLSLFLKTPKLYLSGNWGAKSAVHSTPFHCFNKDENIIIVGFSGDENIYKINLDKTKDQSNFIKEYKAKSNLIENIKPNIKNNNDFKENRAFSATTPHYTNIYYDRYRKIYYRFVTHGVSMKKYKKGIHRKDFSVLILNKDLEIKGEKYFKNGFQKYDPYKVFINKKGLYIARKDMYDKNDDYFSFSKFELSKK